MFGRVRDRQELLKPLTIADFVAQCWRSETKPGPVEAVLSLISPYWKSGIQPKFRSFHSKS